MSVTIAAKISPQELAEIEKLVERGCFLNKSDFTRSAVRDLLERFPSVEDTEAGA